MFSFLFLTLSYEPIVDQARTLFPFRRVSFFFFAFIGTGGVVVLPENILARLPEKIKFVLQPLYMSISQQNEMIPDKKNINTATII